MPSYDRRVARLATASALRSVPSFIAAGAAAFLVASFPSGCAGHAPVHVPTAPSAPPTSPPSPPVPVASDLPKPVAHRFAVAAENATAAAASARILVQGGSAADAAIAGVLTSGVVHPVSSGLGGGGFALVWDPKTRTVSALDFRETAPLGIRLSDYERRRNLLDSKRGVMVGVPGEVAGLAAIHARWGRLAFGNAVRAAADIADGGFPVSPHMARSLKWNEAWLRKERGFGWFSPGVGLLPPKATAKNPALASTLRRIAAEGQAAFYKGAIAEDIVATARGAGSRMTAKDIADYHVEARAPLRASWEGYDVFAMPPESAGGLMILETLGMHTLAELRALGYGTGPYLHILAETFRGAVADRLRTIGDPAFVKVDVAALANPARMRARRAKISLAATTPAEAFTLHEAGTSHLVVVDDQGCIVSITSTVNDMFGSKLLTAGGFVLNDELDDFATRSLDHRFGVPWGHGPNAPRGGARPASSMVPTIVLKDGAPVLTLGGSGGLQIATSVTEVLLARLAFGRGLAEAVADPRIDTPPTGGLFVDASAPLAVLSDLIKRGEVVESTKPNYSAVQAIAIGERAGVRFLEAAADPRKGGAAVVE